MATAGPAKRRLVGRWRIVETESWEVDDLDLLDPAHLTLEARGRGRLGLLAIEAELDYRVVQREGLQAIEFSFEGSNEGQLILAAVGRFLMESSFGVDSSSIRATTLGLRRAVPRGLDASACTAVTMNERRRSQHSRGTRGRRNHLKWRLANVRPEPGLQIPFKRLGLLGLGKLDEDHHTPWTAARRVERQTSVVRHEPGGEVRRQAAVLPAGRGFASDDVDAGSGCMHVPP